MSKLTIYKASAGSGKTYTLTNEYIDLLLMNHCPGKQRLNNHQHILAVTFTRKATAEMKERIIKKLDEIRNNVKITNNDKQPFDQNAAKAALKDILHDYTHFNILTIDTFFQKVVRAFAWEMDLFAKYDVSLDTDAAVEEAFKRLIAKIDNNPALQEHFKNKALQNLEDGKNWNSFHTDLIKDVAKENFLAADDSSLLFYKNIGQLKEPINKFLKAYKEAMKNIALEFRKEVLRQNLSVNDFVYKGSGVYNYMYNKLASNDFKEFELKGRALEALEKNKWYTGKTPVFDTAPFNQLIRRVADLHNAFHQLALNAAASVKTITDLAIASPLLDELRAYVREQNIALISEAPAFIKRIIENSDAPFIYEKVGEKFHHFMIDEFQDTSHVQWNNFKPLIENSLSVGNKNLIVGDVKQAIYRWRNSDWKILQNGIKSGLNNHKANIEEKTLDKNWRSSEEVINFNNNFFEEMVKLVEGKIEKLFKDDKGNNLNIENGEALKKEYISNLQLAYEDVKQIFPEENKGKKPKGYVQIEIIQDFNKNQMNNCSGEIDNCSGEIDNLSGEIDICSGEIDICSGEMNNCSGEMEKDEKLTVDERKMLCYERIIPILQDLYLKGYKSKDIAILCRGRKELAQIAQYIMEHKPDDDKNPNHYTILSNEAMYINKAPAVKFIIAALQYLVNNENKIAKYIFDNSEFYNEKVNIEPSLKKKPIYELVAEIVRRFIKLDKCEDKLALQTFMDVVHEFNKGQSPDINDFLNYWKENAEKIKVAMSDNIDAIRMMTIHQSKGLEFKAVIMPYCDWKFEYPNDIIWADFANNTFAYNNVGEDIAKLNKDFPNVAKAAAKLVGGLGNLGNNNIYQFPVFSSKSGLANTSFFPEYIKEKFMKWMDHLNLIYVAFTRAKQALYLVIPEGNKDGYISKILLETKDKSAESLPLTTCVQNNESWVKKLVYGELINIKDESTKEEEGDAEQGANSGDLILNLPMNEMPMPHIGGKFGEIDGKSAEQVRGEMMHYIFSNILTEKDIEQAVEIAIQDGLLDEQEREGIIQEIHKMMLNEKVAEWFSGKMKIRTETPILTPKGAKYIPDRVMIDGNRAVVVDYKFGKVHDKKYIAQVKNYLGLLQEMGYNELEAYIYYPFENEIVSIN